jgi:hypothetical protein
VFSHARLTGAWGDAVANKRKAYKGKPYNGKWNKNEKLEKTSGGTYNVIGFGLPADHAFIDAQLVERNTCPGALACRAVCFAKQGRYNMPNVKDARQHNLMLSQSADFAPLIVADLNRMRSIDTVRIHDSGDFYSQDYLDKWATVARALPHLTFYAYTKSLNLNLSNLPDNLRITQSLGGRFDKLVNLNAPHSRIFADHGARKRARYVDGNVSDAPAIEGERRIGLVYHGQRNLTPAQKKFFS